MTWCFRSLALKKPARWILLSRLMYKVAPMPHLVTDPSVTIHDCSDGRGSVMDLCSASAF